MNHLVKSSVIALAMASVCPTAAYAQDAAAVAKELSEMRAQMERMAGRITELESALATAKVETASAAQTADKAVALASEVKEKPPVEVTWRGAPQLKHKDGWSFKPRGRLQFDAGTFSAPDSTGRIDGYGSELRRARLGVDGTIPGGFGYRFDIDFGGNEVEISDAYLTYDAGKLELTVGNHNNFQGLEELTSDLHTSFTEKASFTDAFGFERRLGVSAQYAAKDVILQGGVFGDSVSDLSSKRWSLDGRAVYMPKLGSTQLHLGASLHYADRDPYGNALRYRQRPFVHYTVDRYVDTGSFSAQSETGYGLEAAVVAGPFHATGEAFWQKVSRKNGFPDPTFFGGYAEVGYFLTKGDTRTYKDGTFDRIRPSRPVGSGGIGAVQANLRYDYLDLSDQGIIGGRQSSYMASVVWTPTAYTRLMLNYAHMQFDDAAFPAGGGNRDYGIDAVTVRAQLDF